MLNEIAVAQYSRFGYREKDFQISLFPGISTNGISSGLYFNKFSLNLTSGFSAGNHYLEIGVVSNSNTRSSTGIQLAGLANTVGVNSYINMTLKDRHQLEDEGDKSNMTGLQFSGLLNFVRNDLKGFQFTGGFNVSYGNAKALQVGGLGNTVNLSFQGTQLAGIYNYVGQSAGGIQVASIYNYAKDEIVGFQIGSINRTRRLAGRNSVQKSTARGRQIGLINISNENDGIQIGLINFTGEFHGTQIGLVNFYKTGPYPGGNDKLGLPIGLLNLGSIYHKRIFSDDLFIVNGEITTGHCSNCTWTESKMPINSSFMVLHTNALIYGHNYWDIFREFQWTVGYGFERIHYYLNSKSKMDALNYKYFFSYGLRFQHLNRGRELNGELSLLSRGHFEIGYYWKLFYLFAGPTVNLYFGDRDSLNRSLQLAEGNFESIGYQAWVGYQFGFQIR